MKGECYLTLQFEGEWGDFAHLGRQAHGDGVYADFKTGARKGVGQNVFAGIGTEQNGLLIAKETLIGPGRGEVPGRLGGIEQVEARLAVVVAVDTPVDVKKAVGVKTIEHKGMAVEPHGTAGVTHRPAGLNFAA